MTDAPATTWEAALGQLQLRVTRANYDTWLRDTVGVRHEGDAFVVGAHSEFAREWLSVRMRTLVTQALAGVLGHPIRVEFEVVRQHDDDGPALHPTPDGDPAAAPRPRRTAPPALNPRLTFEEFVVGQENRVAFEAARSVAETPGAVNPLFIFGSSGLGKTHLLHAIGHEAYARGQSVIYAPAERFGNDFVRASQTNGFEQLRNRYRNADLLLIDDVQFFEGKERFQEEFFHTFNDLHSAGKQIVVTADRVPSRLAGLVDSLRSRLQWGLAADLDRPGFETRFAILRAKAQRHALKLPEEALQIIADRCCPTVRELEGYLNRVLAYVPLIGDGVTREVIDRALSPFASRALVEPDPPSADDVLAAVARRTGAQPSALRGRSRARDVAYARHLAMYVMKEDARLTVAEIGRELGNRDHSTVLAGINRIALERTTRPETSQDIEAVRASLAPEAPAAAVG
jgi:chromosomal replication initiator protein